MRCVEIRYRGTGRVWLGFFQFLGAVALSLAICGPDLVEKVPVVEGRGHGQDVLDRVDEVYDGVKKSAAARTVQLNEMKAAIDANGLAIGEVSSQVRDIVVAAHLVTREKIDNIKCQPCRCAPHVRFEPLEELRVVLGGEGSTLQVSKGNRWIPVPVCRLK